MPISAFLDVMNTKRYSKDGRANALYLTTRITSTHPSPSCTLQELNLSGTHLLFRDKRHQLHLYDLQTQQRSSLLDYCQYVQWVPGSDVIVAQSRGSLCIWYSVKDPER